MAKLLSAGCSRLSARRMSLSSTDEQSDPGRLRGSPTSELEAAPQDLIAGLSASKAPCLSPGDIWMQNQRLREAVGTGLEL